MKVLAAAAAAMAVLFGSAAAQAATNLVVNGDFEQTTNGLGQFDSNTKLVGWSSTGYNFVMGGSTADSVGAEGIYGNLKLWGPANGSNNGLGASPAGGNFVAADGAYMTEAIQQTISGLTPGKLYNVSFYWGGAQQLYYDGANTEQWTVSLGNESHATEVYSNPSHGFSGWRKETFSFTAQNGSEVLSFLAHGTPNGVPPFSVLDGVKMTAAVPEPATWGLMIVGLGLAGAALRRRQVAAPSAA